MGTAIIYTSSHGTTERIAQLLKAEINKNNTDIIKLKLRSIQNLNQYEQIIIGTSIHAGRIPRNMQKFMLANADVLKDKKLGLYLCCMYEGEKAQEQLKNAFPDLLSQHAVSTQILGGEFLFEKMNFLERAIVRKVAGVKESVSKIKMDEIKKFAKSFK